MLSFPHPLIFIRHGETPWNSRGLYQGTTDIELSALGKEQAHNNGSLVLQLIKDGLIQVDQLKLISSPLLRANQTAQIISDSIGYSKPIAIEPKFQELSMGRWEGLTSPQVKQQFYKERQGRKLNRWSFKPLGGESMAERSDELAATIYDLKPHGLIVTHSVVLRIIIQQLTGSPKETAAQATFPHEGILRWDGAIMHRHDIIA